MPKSIEERTQQLQNAVAQLVDSVQRGNLRQEEVQQKNDELQALLAQLSQQMGQEHQAREHHVDAFFGEQFSTARITEIKQRLAIAEDELKQTNEKCQTLLNKQSELIDRLSKRSEEQINALREKGFFAKANVNPAQETPESSHNAQP
ncbi:MAG: hypothetical protein P4L79_07405 [Legionella sp.]|uniref:hypothetical protein n=1 Tax=Legionella sp. TaxID=459 RepID=UPI0028409C8D|nr:hypothetical protein [Legionella sp.]